MTDAERTKLIERLRQIAPGQPHRDWTDFLRQAADELTRLAAENKRLIEENESLRPDAILSRIRRTTPQ